MIKFRPLWSRLPALVSALSLSGPLATAAISLDFEEASYTVTPGEQITVRTAFGGSIPHGLDAYFIRLEFAGDAFEVKGEGIGVPPELDFGLFDPGAERSVAADFAQVRGFAEFGSPYTGTDFAAFTLTVSTSAPAGVYTLTLSIPQENSFVDGAQNVLDEALVLGSASVTIVIPRPAIATTPLINPETGGAMLHFSGLPGRLYRLEVSAGLQSWTTLADILANEEGAILYEDLEAAQLSRRFYRVRGL